MKNFLVIGALLVSVSMLTGCPGSSKSDTTGQLYNDTIFGGNNYTAALTIGGATLTSYSGAWSSKTKLNSCGDNNQTATFVDPGGTTWAWDSLTIACNKHNLITLGFNSATGRPRIGIEQGNAK
ncbi:MAG: hypothetical protein OEV92_07470 [Nitrospinota bacterium]|nr:hypothetical protein [Nitrospinota bacterium]